MMQPASLPPPCPCFPLLLFSLPAAAPLAVDDTFVQSPEGPTIIPGPGILANDTIPCGSAAKVRVTSGPQFGSVLLNSNGGFRYNPSGSTLKADFFQYEIECPGGLVSHSGTDSPSARLVGSAVDWWQLVAQLDERVSRLSRFSCCSALHIVFCCSFLLARLGQTSCWLLLIR